MKTYEFKKQQSCLILKSKRFTIRAAKKNGHIHILIKGPTFRKQGLSAVHDEIDEFEIMVVALHFYKKAREFGKQMPTIQYVNYADIFGSCFE